MAPGATSLPKRKPRENQYLFDLGVRGRKTGLTLPDTGLRDENGLEPMDHLFSSPEKPATRSTVKPNGVKNGMNATLSSEEDMDVGESTIPEPAAVLTERKRASVRLPPARSKSPIKTFLQSPARRNPSLGRVSSPIRGSIVETQTVPASTYVRRKLDFSNGNVGLSGEAVMTTYSPQRREASSNPTVNLVPRTDALVSPAGSGLSYDNADEGNEDGQDNVDQIQGAKGMEALEESYQVFQADDEHDVAEEEEPEEESGREAGEESGEILDPEPQPAKNRGGRPKKPGQLEKPVAKNDKAGLAKKDIIPAEAEGSERPAKKPRRSLEASKPKPKIGRPKKTDVATKPPKAKSRPSKLATVSEADSPEIQRGPPMPRNRGLFILRRETPGLGTTFKQTRSGRTSIRPLAYWKNEKVEYSEDENEDSYGRFLLPRIKEVIRVDEVPEERRTRNKSKHNKSKKRKATPESDEEEDPEPWESEPGRIYGEVRTWDPDDQLGTGADDVEEELALSSAAIITRDIPGANFRFAKTLTMPFFGSGMVELPPGGVKKPKNSRKMQMVFFVFSGRVKVMVNENEFRISRGGMWQVPRGNFYSIENDYESPARIFFAQGCEILEELAEEQ